MADEAMRTDRHSFKSDQKGALSLSVYNVGYEKCRGLHSWGSGVRDHFLLHHIISGKGVYKTPQGEYQLVAGDTFLIYPYTEITYTADKDDPWEYYWAGFNGSDAEVILGHAGFTRECPVISTDFGDELKDSLERIYRFSGNDHSDLVKMTGQLYITLGILMEHSGSSAAEGLSKGYVTKAKNFIAHNFALDIGIENVAEFVGVSRATLYRAFMEQENRSPVKYLTDFRIDKACKLLRETSLPISAVATSAGYVDSLYFSRIFHKVKGVSPAAFRSSFLCTNGENKGSAVDNEL